MHINQRIKARMLAGESLPEFVEKVSRNIISSSNWLISGHSLFRSGINFIGLCQRLAYPVSVWTSLQASQRGLCLHQHAPGYREPPTVWSGGRQELDRQEVSRVCRQEWKRIQLEPLLIGLWRHPVLPLLEGRPAASAHSQGRPLVLLTLWRTTWHLARRPDCNPRWYSSVRKVQ